MCFMKGLKVDMSNHVRPGASSSATPLAQNNSDTTNSRAVLNGIKVRQRSSGSENVLPSSSRAGCSERRSNITPSMSTSSLPNGNTFECFTEQNRIKRCVSCIL